MALSKSDFIRKSNSQSTYQLGMLQRGSVENGGGLGLVTLHIPCNWEVYGSINPKSD